MSSMPSKPKKLLYQLHYDLRVDLSDPFFKSIFSDQDLRQFNADIGDEGRKLYDQEGRLVVSFQNPSVITVAKGYRWDGCSPKFHILDLFWFGTPDGIVVGSERPNDRPDEDRDIPIIAERVTHSASALHDVLGYCKYDENMPGLFRSDNELGKPESWNSSGRRNRDKLFREMLKLKRHQLWWLYYGAVFIFGALFNLIPWLNSANRPRS